MEVKNLKQLTEGDKVIYIDEFGREHDALLTAVWGERSHQTLQLRDGEELPKGWASLDYVIEPSVNLIFVSPDKDRKDSYGRQIERRSSSVHMLPNQAAYGNGWCMPDQVEEVRKIVNERKAEFSNN